MISHILLECIKDKHEKGENVEDEIRNVIKESQGEKIKKKPTTTFYMNLP